VDVGALFDAHAASLCRTVHAMTGNREVAEDIVQEVFIYAHARRHELADSPAIGGWLYRVTVNRVRHHWRSSRRYRSALSRSEDAGRSVPATPDQSLQRLRNGRLIAQCVLTLSEAQREVFVLFELQGLDGKQIAEILDIPSNTVWTRLHRARAAFRKAWLARRGEEEA